MMDIDKQIVRWVEYSICEEAMDIYPKSKSTSTTFNSFCDRLSESIIRNNLNNKESYILGLIVHRANKQYRLTDDEMGIICSNFFIDKRWNKYIRAIELMKSVNWKL